MRSLKTVLIGSENEHIICALESRTPIIICEHLYFPFEHYFSMIEIDGMLLFAPDLKLLRDAPTYSQTVLREKLLLLAKMHGLVVSSDCMRCHIDTERTFIEAYTRSSGVLRINYEELRIMEAKFLTYEQTFVQSGEDAYQTIDEFKLPKRTRMSFKIGENGLDWAHILDDKAFLLSKVSTELIDDWEHSLSARRISFENLIKEKTGADLQIDSKERHLRQLFYYLPEEIPYSVRIEINSTHGLDNIDR